MMRDSVAQAWPAHVKLYEGQLTWMYLDTKYKVTTGTGNLIDTIAAAQALPWYKKDGSRATDVEVTTEWRYIKSRTDLAKRSGWAYQSIASLHLKADTVDRLLTETTARFWAEFEKRWPKAGDWPADAQLASLDLIWQNGYGFTDLKSGSSYVWPNMRAAFGDEDWTRAASAVPGTGTRADHRKRLFRNAASVIKLGASRATLWDTKVPTPPAPTLSSAEELPIMAAATKNVYFRNSADLALPKGGKSLPLNAKGDITVATGPNDGVDLVANIVLTNPNDVVKANWRLVSFKDGTDSVVHHDRLPVTITGSGEVTWKGYIGTPEDKTRQLRLRLFVVPVTEGAAVSELQVSGWTL